ncbi:MAG: hypothetical protein ACPGEF_04560 [Endozoicomonas sp.]
MIYSTDTELDAITIVKYYKACFQTEFVFRDAKQYKGLVDCQSCNKQATHTQINASFSALNLLKLADQEEKGVTGKMVISIVSWKRRLFNQYVIHRVFEKLGLPMNDKKIMGAYNELNSYGAILYKNFHSIGA